MSSTAMKPTLCRFRRYSRPGFPRPTSNAGPSPVVAIRWRARGERQGERVDVEPAIDLLHDAAVFNADRLADQHERDLDVHRLVLADGDEVDVQELAADGIHLVVAHQH